MSGDNEKTLRLSIRALTKAAKAIEESTDICPARIRGARAMLDWTQEELAQKSGVSIMAVKDTESQKRTPRKKTMLMIRQAFEAAGVRFEGGGVFPPERAAE
jgi:transcriptional regulator with XRE-family HTH domain